jgi:peptide/nickel transport system substrate-binding protein
VYTFHLRKGTKWSDGQPFTSEDVRFVYMDMINYRTPDGAAGTVQTWNSLGNVTDVQVVDDYTVKLIAPGGLGAAEFMLSSLVGNQWNSFEPAHYLKQWHFKYNPDAAAQAKKDGFDTWQAAMYPHYWWCPQTDPNLPLMTPWVLKDRSTTAQVYERNPYYWRVDTAGNQLPYLDRFTVSIVNPEVYQLKVSGGSADIAYIHTTLSNLGLYKQGETAGDYKVVLWPGINMSAVTLTINQTNTDKNAEKILRDVKFREAVSVALNRKEINDTVYQGLGVPGQLSLHPTASIYKKDWTTSFAQYDPALANSLLDQAGLKNKDSSGFRLGADGKVFSFIIEYVNAEQTTTLELVKEYLEKVGIKTTIKIQDQGLADQRLNATETMCSVNFSDNPPCGERVAFMQLWQWGSSD